MPKRFGKRRKWVRRILKAFCVRHSQSEERLALDIEQQLLFELNELRMLNKRFPLPFDDWEEALWLGGLAIVAPRDAAIPILDICFGFENAELRKAKVYYSSYSDTHWDKVINKYDFSKLACEQYPDEPVIDGLPASIWLQCVEPTLSILKSLSVLKHRKCNLTYRKRLTESTIDSGLSQHGDFMIGPMPLMAFPRRVIRMEIRIGLRTEAPNLIQGSFNERPLCRNASRRHRDRVLYQVLHSDDNIVFHQEPIEVSITTSRSDDQGRVSGPEERPVGFNINQNANVNGEDVTGWLIDNLEDSFIFDHDKVSETLIRGFQFSVNATSINTNQITNVRGKEDTGNLVGLLLDSCGASDVCFATCGREVPVFENLNESGNKNQNANGPNGSLGAVVGRIPNHAADIEVVDLENEPDEPDGEDEGPANNSRPDTPQVPGLVFDYQPAENGQDVRELINQMVARAAERIAANQEEEILDDQPEQEAPPNNRGEEEDEDEHKGCVVFEPRPVAEDSDVFYHQGQIILNNWDMERENNKCQDHPRYVWNSNQRLLEKNHERSGPPEPSSKMISYIQDFFTTTAGEWRNSVAGAKLVRLAAKDNYTRRHLMLAVNKFNNQMMKNCPVEFKPVKVANKLSEPYEVTIVQPKSRVPLTRSQRLRKRLSNAWQNFLFRLRIFRESLRKRH